MKRRRIDQGPKIDFVDVLSEELILYVFAYLDASDLVKACQLVNRKWSRLSNDQSVSTLALIYITDLVAMETALHGNVS